MTKTIKFSHDTLLIPSINFLAGDTSEIYYARALVPYNKRWLAEKAFCDPHAVIYAVDTHRVSDGDSSVIVDIVDLYEENTSFYNHIAEEIKLNE